MAVCLTLLVGIVTVRGESPWSTIQRIEVPAEQVAAEMKRVAQGALVRLPRKEFEELVERATRAAAAQGDTPRLIQARYVASLQGDGLAGTAEWRLVWNHDVPGRFPLDTLALAIRSMRWADSTPVIVGILDRDASRPIALLVPQRGEHRLLWEWSARGLPDPQGLRVDFRIPNSLIGSLDLDLPTDSTVHVDRDDTIVSGPMASRDPSRHTWRIHFPRQVSGNSIRLNIRRPALPDQPASLLRVRTTSTQRLAPGQLESEYQFDVRVARGEQRRMAIYLDAGVRPRELLCSEADSWHVTPLDGGRSRIDLVLRAPWRQGRIVLRTVMAPPANDQFWVSPAARIVDALVESERLVIYVHPDLRIDEWSVGRFTPIPPPSDNSGWTVLAYQAGAAQGEADSRPRGRIRPMPRILRTRELWEWRLSRDRGELVGEIQVMATRGTSLSHLWDIPAGWKVEDVITRAGDPEVSWDVTSSPTTPGSLLRVEPIRPDLLQGHDRYVLRFSSPSLTWGRSERGETAETILTLPRLKEGSGREGTITVKLDPTLTHEPFASTIEPDNPVNFRGTIEPRIRLRHRSDPLRVQSEARFNVGQRHIRTTYALTLTATEASPQELFLLTPVPWRWRSWRVVAGSVRIRSLEPFLGWGMFGHQVWRVSLDRPIRKSASLELTADPIFVQNKSIPLTIPQPIGAEIVESKASIQVLPGSPWQVETDAPLEVRPASIEQGGIEYSASVGPKTRLRLRAVHETQLSGRVAYAVLMTEVRGDGTRLCRARMVVGNWSSRELPIGVPAEAVVVSVQVGGKPMMVSSSRVDSGATLVLPWNPANDWETVEFVYALPRHPVKGWGRISAEPPQLPFATEWNYSWRWDRQYERFSPHAPWQEAVGSAATMDAMEEWVPEDAGQPTIWLVNTTTVRLASALGYLILIALLLVRPSRHRELFSLGLFIIGLITIWLPRSLFGGIGVLLGAGVILGLLFVGVSIRRRQVAKENRSRSGSASAVVAACLVGGWVGWMSAAPPRPATVFLLPTVAGDEQAVLAAPSLLDELKAAWDRTQIIPPVVLEAKLEGQAAAREVRWTARLLVHSASDSSNVLPLRLGDARLLAAELDNEAVFPEIGAEPGHYEFAIAGRGAHTLVLRFTSAASNGPDHESRFAWSEFPICSATVEFPAGTTEMQFLASRGIQKTDLGRHAPRLEADLGRIGVVHIRWRSPETSQGPPGSAEAVHLWDVTEGQSRLLSVFRLRLGQGALRRVELEVPVGLELTDVVIRPVDDPFNLFGLTSPKDWRQTIQDQQVRHRLDLAVPLSGQVQVEMELVPRNDLPDRWIVDLPEIVGNYERETLAAVRFAGRVLQATESVGWEAIAPGDFLRRRWRPLRVDALDREPDAAFRYVGKIERPLVVTSSRPAKTIVRQRADWRLGPGRAEVQVVAWWSHVVSSAPIEWEVPPHLTINEVRGESVTNWSRVGTVLQVWLSPQRTEPTAVTLDGFMALPVTDGPPFELPSLRPMGIRNSALELAVSAREDWRLSLVEGGSYRQYPTTEIPGQRWVGFAEHPSPTIWRLYRADARITGDVLTVVEPIDREFAFRAVARIDLNVSAGSEVATCWLEVRHGGSELPRIQLPPGVEIRETRPIPRGTRWIIDAPTGPLHVSVVGRSPVEETPFVSVRQPAAPSFPARHFLVVAPSWRLRNPRDIVPDQPPPELLSAALVPADWTGWKIANPMADLTLITQTGLRQTWLEMTVTRSAKGWLVQLAGWLAIEPTATVLAPAQAKWVSVMIDGKEATRLAHSVDAVPMPRGLHVVSFIWQSDFCDLALPRLRLDSETTPLTPVFLSWRGPSPNKVRSSRAALDTVEREQWRQETWNDFIRRLGSQWLAPGELSPRVPPREPTIEVAGRPLDAPFVGGTRLYWKWAENGKPDITVLEGQGHPVTVRVFATLILTLSLLGLILARRA